MYLYFLQCWNNNMLLEEVDLWGDEFITATTWLIMNPFYASTQDHIIINIK